VKVPTGGDGEQSHKPASACRANRRGQQIRCESEADGTVRMEENGKIWRCARRVVLWSPYAL